MLISLNQRTDMEIKLISGKCSDLLNKYQFKSMKSANHAMIDNKTQVYCNLHIYENLSSFPIWMSLSFFIYTYFFKDWWHQRAFILLTVFYSLINYICNTSHHSIVGSTFIVKILNLYIILLSTHLYPFFPLSILELLICSQLGLISDLQVTKPSCYKLSQPCLFAF